MLIRKETIFATQIILVSTVIQFWKNVLVRATSGKNHISEINGDVGMVPYQKERKQEDTNTKTESH